MIKENNEKKNERDMVEVCIENKQKQLQNIVSLIEILENENDTLKKKIKKGKNMNKYYELVENQNNQENKINELNKEIKMKKVELKEHSKCEGIKSELMKKIEAIKEEINMNYGKNTQLKKKLEILENKKKEKEEKEEKLQKKDYKPIIVLSKNMNNINYYRNNNSLNIGYNAKTEENLNKTSIIIFIRNFFNSKTFFNPSITKIMFINPFKRFIHIIIRTTSITLITY